MKLYFCYFTSTNYIQFFFRYVFYVIKQVNLLLSFNIKPILVFDGCHLPAKELTELKRRE